MNKDKIVEIILAVAGNPDSGAFVELAPAIADAIVKGEVPTKEQRVLKPTETR